MKRLVTLIIVFSIVGLASDAYPETLLVPGGFPTIQDGINAASDGDIVLVSDGIYGGAGNKNLDFSGKAITVRSENGADVCIIDCEGDGRGFYFHSGEGAGSVIEGFTIRNGAMFYGGGILCWESSPTIIDNTISDNFADFGGAIYCESSSVITQNNTIVDNKAVYSGGGVSCYMSSGEITGNVIQENECLLSSGGGVSCTESSTLIKANELTGNNAAQYGSAIDCDNASPMIIDNVISGNANISGGGSIVSRNGSSPECRSNTISDNYESAVFCDDSSISISGGTISGNKCGVSALFESTISIDGVTLNGNQNGAVYVYECSMDMTNCVVSNNSNDYGGGGISAWKYSDDHEMSIRISDCTIMNNHTSDWYGGGGIYIQRDLSCSDYDCSISDCVISSNTADNNGAGIICRSTSPIINNCLFDGNATVDGGGQGGGVYAYDIQSVPTIIGSTFVGNTCMGNGGAVCAAWDGSAQIYNSIFWGNLPDSLNDGGVPFVISHSDVQGGYAGTGNIDADPLFASGLDGNYYLSQVASGQESDSPCINAGNSGAENHCFDTPCLYVCMDKLTTRTDSSRDVGLVDMGYHYGYSSNWCTVSSNLDCIPTTGTVPFSTILYVTLTNAYSGQQRRISAHLDATLASGTQFPNWRAGFTNIAAGETYETAFPVSLPASGAVIGENIFVLVAEDVTPQPYNLPPYPPSGVTSTSTCTVTGISP